MIEAGEIGRGASAGNAGWVTPTLGTPLAAPGILRTGLRSALDPKGALVIRPRLDPLWARWLWGFARSSRPEVFKAGVAALLGLTRRTLDELDAMRDAGVEFEEHRAGLLAWRERRTGWSWFDLVFGGAAQARLRGRARPRGPTEARELEPALGPERATRCTRRSTDTSTRPRRRRGSPATSPRRRDGDDGFAVRAIGRNGCGWRVFGPEGRFADGDRSSSRPRSGRRGCCGRTASTCRSSARRATRSRAARRPDTGLALYLCEPKLGLTPLAAGLRIAGFFELGARNADPSVARARQLVEETRPFVVALDGSSFARGRPGGPGSGPRRPTACRCSARCPAHPGSWSRPATACSASRSHPRPASPSPHSCAASGPTGWRPSPPTASAVDTRGSLA